MPKLVHLKECGCNLTTEARDGTLLPVVGREDVIDRIIETLCRCTKRNPLLVGPAGVGKTAIVEGFAQRIVRGDVPSFLSGSTLILLQPTAILAGSGGHGALERKMLAILQEATQPGIILFIDEAHAIIGAGGMPGISDIASYLKPALARDKIACIAATTDDEFRRYFEQDSALERRFQPIRVQEMDECQVLAVLSARRDYLHKERRVFIEDRLLQGLFTCAKKHLRNRNFPDKAVDLLEQCVASAVKRGVSTLTPGEADSVVRTMIGMPLEIGERIEMLRQTLDARSLLTVADRACLVDKLQITMRGYDVRMWCPNATLLFVGEAARHARVVAETISSSLFQDGDRVITIDLGRVRTPEDITLLLGAPPGYIGFNENVPLHRVKQHPWCVILLENIDSCHPQVQRVVGQALQDGFFVDGRNSKIYLGDTIVIFTAPRIRHEGVIGFQSDAADGCAAMSMVQGSLDESILSHLDLMCRDLVPGGRVMGREWIRNVLLEREVKRYLGLGIRLRWDESFVTLLEKRGTAQLSEQAWERILNEEISPAILSCVGDNVHEEKNIVIRCVGDRIGVECITRL